MNDSAAPIGIVTVTYSPGEYLTRFLDSVPGATDRGAVVVMADNGSTDGAPEAAEAKYSFAELLHTGGNIGYGAGMDRGIDTLRARRAAGEIDDEFVVIVNPDVVFHPGAVDELIAAAERHPRAGAVGPLIHEVDGSVYPSARAVPTLVSGIGHALLGKVWKDNPFSRRYRDDADMTRERTSGWLSGSCQLLRWDAFDAIGGFDERYFMYMEDMDLGDRLARSGRGEHLHPGGGDHPRPGAFGFGPPGDHGAGAPRECLPVPGGPAGRPVAGSGAVGAVGGAEGPVCGRAVVGTAGAENRAGRAQLGRNWGAPPVPPAVAVHDGVRWARYPATGDRQP